MKVKRRRTKPHALLLGLSLAVVLFSLVFLVFIYSEAHLQHKNISEYSATFLKYEKYDETQFFVYTNEYPWSFTADSSVWNSAAQERLANVKTGDTIWFGVRKEVRADVENKNTAAFIPIVSLRTEDTVLFSLEDRNSSSLAEWKGILIFLGIIHLLGWCGIIVYGVRLHAYKKQNKSVFSSPRNPARKRKIVFFVVLSAILIAAVILSELSSSYKRRWNVYEGDVKGYTATILKTDISDTKNGKAVFIYTNEYPGYFCTVSLNSEQAQDIQAALPQGTSFSFEVENQYQNQVESRETSPYIPIVSLQKKDEVLVARTDYNAAMQQFCRPTAVFIEVLQNITGLSLLLWIGLYFYRTRKKQ